MKTPTLRAFTFLTAISLVTAGVAGCKKDEASSSSGAPAAKGGGGSGGGAAAKTASVTLPKVHNLKAEVPAGAKVEDGIVGSGNMIQGPGFVVSVEEASDSRPKTAADAKSEADMYSPKNLKDEALADGWAVTFDNTGSMGANYFVQVRREIGGKAIWCETTAPDKKAAATALEACKSLKP